MVENISSIQTKEKILEYGLSEPDPVPPQQTFLHLYAR